MAAALVVPLPISIKKRAKLNRRRANSDSIKITPNAAFSENE